LSDDGVIFISIDDNEVHNLRKVCDEVFGEGNFVAQICHKSRASISNDKIISPNHNTIMFYTKNYTLIHEQRKFIGLDPNLEGFGSDDNDGRGPYRLVPVDGPGGASNGNPHYEFMGIVNYWRFSKTTMQEKFDNGYVVKRGNSLYQKYYLSTAKETRRTDNTWWDDGGLMSTATSRLKQLMGGESFDTPKPVELVFRMLKLITFFDKNSIILDFFSGSATTAHAVMKLNAEDGGNRKYITVQLPEPTDEKSEAYKAGYKNICEIGKERIRRAGDKIVSELKEKQTGQKTLTESEETVNPDDLNIGFKVFKLDTSNIKKWNPDPKANKEKIQKTIEDTITNILPGRTEEDLLYEIMLKFGIDLTYRIETMEVDGKKVYQIGNGMLYICLDDDISVDIAQHIVNDVADKEPESTRVVFKDNGFKGANADAMKTNVVHILKTAGIQEIMSV